MKKQIHFELSEEEMEQLEKIQSENKLSTSAATFRFLMKTYEEQQQAQETMATKIADAVCERQKSTLKRIMFATNNIEENTTVLVDVANTMITVNNMKEMVMADIAEYPTIKASREHYHEKIAEMKQKKDDRNNKKGVIKGEDK